MTQGYNEDIYVRQHHDQLGIPDITIGNLIRRYWNCVGIDKTKCLSGNMRIHNIDFRRNPEKRFDLISFHPKNNIN